MKCIDGMIDRIIFSQLGIKEIFDQSMKHYSGWLKNKYVFFFSPHVGFPTQTTISNYPRKDS